MLLLLLLLLLLPPKYLLTSLHCCLAQALEYGSQLQPHRPHAELRRALSLDGSDGSSCTAPVPPQAPQLQPRRTPPRQLEGGTVLHVSPGGSDAAAGTAAAPYKTLHHAVVMARAAGRGSTVLLASGTYHLAETLELTAADDELTIAAAAGAEPVLSGGVPLDLPPSVWSRHRTLPSGRSVFVTKLPPGTPTFDQLFVGDTRQIRAKHPNGNPETMSHRQGCHTDCGYVPRQYPRVSWLTAANLSLPTAVHQADWSQGAPPDLPEPGADGYILNVTSPMCANCSSRGGERKTYQAVVGGVVAAKYDPPILPGPPRAHMHATTVPIGVSGVPFPHMQEWSNVKDGIVVDMQAQAWGNFWWRIANVSVDKDQRQAGNVSGTIHFGEGGTQIGQGGNGGDFFYVENILELLDDEMEWYRRDDELYYMPPGSGGKAPEMQSVVGGGVIEVLVNVSGARNVTLRGLKLTHTKITTLEPYLVPSCGDWAVHVGGSVLATETAGLTIEQCEFTRTGGNAIFLHARNTDTTITDNGFYLTGESAIVLLGSANFVDGTEGNYPQATLIEGNFARRLGVYGKQISFVFQALAARTHIQGNIAFDGPRAAINFNDNFGGGSTISQNLLFSWVRLRDFVSDLSAELSSRL